MERTTSIVLKLSSELSRYAICIHFDCDGALMNTIVGQYKDDSTTITPSAELKPNLQDKITCSLQRNIGKLLIIFCVTLSAMTRVILDDETCDSDNRKYSHFQRLTRITTSPKALAGLGMSSGLLMGVSFLWLNIRMELNHTSPIMGWVKTSHFS